LSSINKVFIDDGSRLVNNSVAKFHSHLFYTSENFLFKQILLFSLSLINVINILKGMNNPALKGLNLNNRG